MQRYNPDYKTGLTHEQVNKRKEENLINYDTTVKTKSISIYFYMPLKAKLLYELYRSLNSAV